MFDSEGNIIEEPEDEEDETALPAGEYLLRIEGTDTYVGAVEVPFYILESEWTDYSMLYEADGELLTLDDGRRVYNVVWDGQEHVITATAYSELPSKYKPGVIDEDVAITYYVGEDEVEELVFSDANEYEIAVVSKKVNYEAEKDVINLNIHKREVGVAIDSATMVEGEVPELNYTLTAQNFEGPVDEGERL